MWRVGHRGASGTYPENTMLAFRKAIELGCDALELDVHVCKSGEAVVIHDDTLERTTSGHGKVNAYTLAELHKLDAGKGELIPTLEAVLSEFARDIVIFIEVKEAAVAAPAADLVTRFAKTGIPYDHMPVIGFGDEWLFAAKSRDNNILIGMSPDYEKPLDLAYCAYAKSQGAWSVNPCIDHLHEEFVENAHRHGLKVVTWTANSPITIARAKALKVDGIISDYPDRI